MSHTRTGSRGAASGPFSVPAITPAGWSVLFSAEGLEQLKSIETERAGGVSAFELGSRLRTRGTPPDEAAALLNQADLRSKARVKFGEAAAGLLFTQAGLEQASRRVTAEAHARRFVDAGCHTVADLGCGIAAESLAFLAAGLTVRAVEIDPFTARIARHNLTTIAASLGVPPPQIIVEDAEHTNLTGADGIFLDPARRTAGHRNTRRLASPDDYSPSLHFAFNLAGRFPTGVKLGPGLDRELIPDTAEAQWVSVDGQVVETGLWFGAAARPGIRRAALVVRGGESHELTAAEDAPDVDARPLGTFVYEPDGAVIRARLIGMLAEQLGAGMMSDGIAYLTADSHTETPFAQTFRIIEELPSNEKQLRRALADRGIGSLEIKKRGADIDPATLRTRLKLRGPNHATLVLTRSLGSHVALLTERC